MEARIFSQHLAEKRGGLRDHAPAWAREGARLCNDTAPRRHSARRSSPSATTRARPPCRGKAVSSSGRHPGSLAGSSPRGTGVPPMKATLGHGQEAQATPVARTFYTASKSPSRRRVWWKLHLFASLPDRLLPALENIDRAWLNTDLDGIVLSYLFYSSVARIERESFGEVVVDINVLTDGSVCRNSLGKYGWHSRC